MKLTIKNSSVLENGAAKPVTAAQMEYGELALNYNSADPALFFKDNANAIRKFAISVLPDKDNAANQAGTYDDRYLRGDIGGTVSGSITASSFIGGVTRIGSSPPTAYAAGELWFNTNDGRLYIYYTDQDNTSQWIDAAPDTFELTQNYYLKSEVNAQFASKTGDSFSGTVSFLGSNSSSNVIRVGYGSNIYADFQANGNIVSGSAGSGQTTDQGYKIHNTGTFESYTPQTSNGDTIKAVRVYQGTSENASISASGKAVFTQIEGNVIITSPNNTKYQLVVDNSGNLSTTPV